MRRPSDLQAASDRTELRLPGGQHPLRIINLRFRPPAGPAPAVSRSAALTAVPDPAPTTSPLGVPLDSAELREGAGASLDTINVLTDSLMAAGTDAAWGDPRPRFEVVAWVRNFDEDREVWVDLYVDGADQVHAQLLSLDYFAPAGGGGDLFRLNLAFPPEHRDPARHGVAGVAYRLYGRIGNALYTDGILHQHRIGDLHAP